MTTSKEALIYQKISKICGIAIPLLYLAALLTVIGAMMVIGSLMFTSGGTLEINNIIKLEIDNVSLFSRVVLTSGAVVVFTFLLRFFWMLLYVAKMFKIGNIFENTTAEYARSAAFNFLLLNVFTFLVTTYSAFIAGDINIGLPAGIASIVFVYMFAWVLKIGSQLKAENDLTV